MEDIFCKFEYINDLEVQCPLCLRAFSGTPERYAERIVCDKKRKGPGTDLTKIFESWAKMMRMNLTSCFKCKSLALEMDKRGKEWVRDNVDELAKAIKKNASIQGHRVPRAIIKHMLRKVSKE
jgi:hypothetical protein